MATLDWSQCPAVESVAGRLSGAWVFRDTRMPVSAVFENLAAGATIDEIAEWFDIAREQIIAVLEFTARSLEAKAPVQTSPAPRLMLVLFDHSTPAPLTPYLVGHTRAGVEEAIRARMLDANVTAQFGIPQAH